MLCSLCQECLEKDLSRCLLSHKCSKARAKWSFPLCSFDTLGVVNLTLRRTSHFWKRKSSWLWIPHFVVVRTLRVITEVDCGKSPRLQFLEVAFVEDHCVTPECSNVRKIRCFSVPEFVWSLVIEFLGWMAIQKVDSVQKSMRPEFATQICVFEKRANFVHYEAI